MTAPQAARTLLPALALAVVGLSAGCSPGSSTASAASTDKAPFHLSDQPAKTDHVDLPKSYKFLPRVVEVKQGTAVTWTNMDPVSHTTTSDDNAWDSGPLATGASHTVALTQPGTYKYHCAIHPFMVGTVVVQG